MMDIRPRHWAAALAGAAILHAGALLAFWEPSEAGTAASAGSGGIAMSLGPAGAPSGSASTAAGPESVAPVRAPTALDATATTEEFPTLPSESEAVPAPAAEVPAFEMPEIEEVAAVLEELRPTNSPPSIEPVDVTEVSAVEAAPAVEAAAAEVMPLPEVPPAKPEPPLQAGAFAAAAQPVASIAGDERTAAVPDASGRGGEAVDKFAGAGDATPGGGIPGAVGADYAKLLSSWIQKHHEFPERAFRRRQYGEVTVSFAIDRDGNLIRCEVIASSGYQLLDEAALATMRRSEPLPAIPEEMPDKVYSSRIGIRFEPPG